jgi:imidazolonepropionase
MPHARRRFVGRGRLLGAGPIEGPWAICASDGRITFVGGLENAPDADEVVDLGVALVTPGLVDAHTHPVFAGDRADEAAARLAGEPYTGGGILRTVAATRAASDAELVTLVRGRLLAARDAGTTAIECKSGYGLSLTEELRALRLIRVAAEGLRMRVVRTFLGAHAVPPNVSHADYVATIVDEMLPAVVSEADACDVFCDAGFFSLAEAERILSAAAARGLGVRLHAEQLARTGAAELGVRLGATSVDHLEHLDPAGVAALAASSTVATLLPGPALLLRGALPPARELLDAGATVAIASDANAGTWGAWSLATSIGLAAITLRMTVAEAVSAATAGGAAALGLSDVCGSLRPGLAADFVTWDADHEGAFALRLGEVRPQRVVIGGEDASAPPAPPSPGQMSAETDTERRPGSSTSAPDRGRRTYGNLHGAS